MTIFAHECIIVCDKMSINGENAQVVKIFYFIFLKYFCNAMFYLGFPIPKLDSCTIIIFKCVHIIK